MSLSLAETLLYRLTVQRFRWTYWFHARSSADSDQNIVRTTLPTSLQLRISNMYPFTPHDNPYEIHGMLDDFQSVSINCTPMDVAPSFQPVKCTSGGQCQLLSVHFCGEFASRHKIPVFQQIRVLNLYNFSPAAVPWTSEVFWENADTLESLSCAIALPVRTSFAARVNFFARTLTLFNSL